jgi:hypothetical protein
MPYKVIFSLLTMLVVMVGCADSSKQSPDSELKSLESSDIELGRYLIKIMGCNDCHTPGYMSNSNIPEDDWLIGDTLGFHGSYGTAYPTNLRLLFDSISEEDWKILARQMREDSPMAWVRLPSMTEEHLRATYRFVKYLGPKGIPAPARLPAGLMPKTSYIEYPDPHIGK